MGPADPEDLATELRKQLGIHERSFNLLRLVRDAGIKVVFQKNREKMPAGAEGFSLSSQSGDLIIIDTTRPFKMRLRFTLAHELGHILLGHSCRSSDIHACSREARETDANIFAAALLMPQDLFLSDIAGRTLSLTNLNYLSDLYQVSLTAAALRFVGLTEEACAVCSFRGADSAWVKKSGAAKGLSIRKYPIKGSLMSSHLRSGQASPLAASVPARCWIDSPQDPGTVLREEFIKTSLETALVLLSNLPVGHATAPADSTGDPAMQKCPRAVPAPTDRLKERSNNTGFSHLVATLPGRNVKGQDQNSIGTGLRELDLLLGGGFQPGKLTLISGRRESGRTSFLLSVARHAALRENRYVAAIMMGHSPEKLQRMIIASETGTPLNSLYSMPYTNRTKRAETQLKESLLHVFVPPHVELPELCKRTHMIAQRSSCSLLLIDDIHRIIGRSGATWSGLEEGRAALVRELRILARESHIPIVVICDSSPEAEQSTGQRLRLADLEGTSSLEEHADAVLLLQAGRSTEVNHREEITISVAKNRNGATGDVEVYFDKRFFSFLPGSSSKLRGVYEAGLEWPLSGRAV